MKTILKDRILWFDGESSFNLRDLSNRYLSGRYTEYDQITHVDNEETRLFAEINKNFRIKKEINIDDIDPNVWNIEEFSDMDMDNYLLSLLKSDISNNKDTKDERVNRFILEMQLIKDFSLENFIKTAAYIVHKLNEQNQVWGVGRGSACASYVLYLLGVHDVDPVTYDLDCYDFFRHK